MKTDLSHVPHWLSIVREKGEPLRYGRNFDAVRLRYEPNRFVKFQTGYSQFLPVPL